MAEIDPVLNGGLAGNALHEFFAERHGDCASAIGFALLLASRTAPHRPLVVVQQDFLDAETGRLNASGLNELSIDPARVLLVRAHDVEAALRAGEQAVRCPSVGAALIALWGESNLLDLKSSRRLTLASAKSGVPALMVRAAAAPAPSAAETRWTVSAGRSRPLAANAPGLPCFVAKLVRNRHGVADRAWCLEWDRDRKCFDERLPSRAPLSRPVVPASRDGPLAPERPLALRRTG